MPAAGETCDPLTELRDLHLWRKHRLLELGVPEVEAARLAVARDFDWHDAERLIRKGCPPRLVFKILT